MTHYSQPSLTSLPISLDRLDLPVAERMNVALYMLRLDQIHPQVSGNKWYKLRYNLSCAKAQGYKRVISFGGAYSNHLHALAWAGREAGIETVGIVRGEPEYASNPTLTDARQWGMQLQFVSRKEYRCRADEDYLKQLLIKYPDAYIVPEGGSNALAVKGFEDIFELPCWQNVPAPDLLVSACGTGGTLAGLIAAKPASLEVLGIPVLKGAEFLYRDIAALLDSAHVDPVEGWSLDLDGHEGGYAKITPALHDFIAYFEKITKIELDPVYTGKMMFRLHKLIELGKFAPGRSIVAVHTGGLQGRRGFL